MENSDIPRTSKSFSAMVRENYTIEKKRVLKQHKVPTRIVEMFDRYVLYHVHPGEFIVYCLENDFKRAITSADAEALHYIYNIAIFIVNVLPGGCHGDPDRVERWLKRGNQKEKEAEAPSAG